MLNISSVTGFFNLRISWFLTAPRFLLTHEYDEYFFMQLIAQKTLLLLMLYPVVWWWLWLVGWVDLSY